MSLDTTTLTGTNIPDIAARNVEQRIKTFLDGLQILTEAFFAAQGIEATFWDSTPYGDVSQSAHDLLAPIQGNYMSDGFPKAWWDDEEGRLNAQVLTIFPDMPDPVIAVGHS